MTNDRARPLDTATAELLDADDERAVVAAATRSVQRRYAHATCALLVLRGDELRSVAAEGPAGEVPGASVFRTKVGVGTTGLCAQTRRVVNVPDTGADARYIEVVPGARSEICVPLVGRDELLGVLVLDSPRPRAFSKDDEEELGAFARLVGLALMHARTDETRERDISELAALSEISQRMSEVATLNEVLATGLDGAMRITGGDAGLIWRRGDDKLFSLAASLALDVERLTALPPNDRRSLSNVIVRTGEPVLIPDIQVDERATSKAAFPDHHSAIGVPLQSEGHIYGTMFTLRKEPDFFSERHVGLVRIVAAYCGAALARAHAFEEATRLSITDELTGFFNARYLRARLNEELARAQRYGDELALVLIDSDALKNVNDKLGHEAGNEHLRELARTIRQQVRATDIVARYGGDEFVVLQPEAGIDAARATAERIRKAVPQALEGVATSVSVGVAAFPNVRDADSLFREADHALAEAKRRGKNTVVVAGGPAA